MEYLGEELSRLVVTVVITALVIAAGAWLEYRSGFLESLINLPTTSPVESVTVPAP
ncbi:MAG: hypothetical protein AAB538_02490 [Patescibacteria group bacterium]